MIPYLRAPTPLLAPKADPEPGLGFAIDRVRDNLGMFATVRGARMRSSSFVVKSRSGRPENAGGVVYVYSFTFAHSVLADAMT